MKKLYIFLILIFAVVVGNAQIINIPDANFKAKLLSASPSNIIAKNMDGSYFKIDSNNNGEIEVAEATQVSSLSVSSASIASLEGISSFSSLSTLVCSYNQLTDLSLTTQTNLSTLRCENNQINSLTINSLSSLYTIYCNNNQITSLNLSGCNSLGSLICNDNLLTTITFPSLGNSFWYLDCKNNQLTTLLLASFNNMRTVICSNNQIVSLTYNASYFEELRCNNNLLQTLNTSNLSSLAILDCSNNLLTKLDISANRGLNYLKCSSNQIEALNIKNGRTITTQLFNGNPPLRYICCDDSRISNTISAASQNGYPFGSVEVNTYCFFAPGGYAYTFQSNYKYDSNLNGCASDDPIFTNLKLLITSGAISYWHIPSPSGNNDIAMPAGTYTFTPLLENTTYYNVSPVSTTITFPATSSPFTQNFCITPNGQRQDIESWIVPLDVPRPGFNSRYKIFLKNKGNITVSGHLNFSFDDDYMDFVSAAPTPAIQNYSLLSWNYVDLVPFETRVIDVVFNMNTPLESLPLNAGDLIKFESNAFPLNGDETQTDNSNYLRQIVVNSHDPNDKRCSEGNAIEPEFVGNYVHYIIRFENTGTFAAENIVVKDIIDTTKFDISTLIPLSGSASFVTDIKNTNQVEFIFENINLPFDDANNDGYVAFKIKTKPTLVIGNTFSNSANIYFDYNFPIITNTETTIIQALATSDFDFGTMFTLAPIPAKQILTISTKQDVLISSISIYNTLGQLIQVITNPNETIDISGLKTGNYIIKILSDKGTASSKFVKH